MSAVYSSLPAVPPKLCVSLALAALCAFNLWAQPPCSGNAWSCLWSKGFSSAASGSGGHVGFPSIQAGGVYYSVSQRPGQKEDTAFDASITALVETSQNRVELVVAMLEAQPARAQSCATPSDAIACRKLVQAMTVAVGAMAQAQLAVASYQDGGVVAEPVLRRVQQQRQVLRDVSLRYPGIGPNTEF